MKFPLLLTALALSAALYGQDGTRVVPGSGVIDTPGRYVLNNDATLRSHGASILITASNVWLNLNGNTVMGPGGKTGTGIHIRGVSGVHVSNGFIVNTAFGVIVENSNSVSLSGLQIRGEGLAITSLPPETGIMIMQSRNVTVRNNSIYNTGLGIFVRGGRSSGNHISGNTVTGGSNAALGICYNPTDSDANGPRGDLIEANLVSGFNVGIQFSDRSMANLANGNTIAYRTMAFDIRNNTNKEQNTTSAQLP
ncbi:MAG: right-handed parallel beta-helix repeat-containing protein [Bryobacterales bacterium]|nr:right-handed parallel beta-helix repeat-containing protein [Bryobacterales bacterium]